MNKAIVLSVAMLAATAQAETFNYEFSGSWNGPNGSLAYTGSFAIVDPVETSRSINGLQWEGISTGYSGGTNFHITFANGASAHANTFDIRVNNAEQVEAGSPFPVGMSSQFWFNSTVISNGMPSDRVCSPAPCGPNDVPLYQRGDSFEQAVQGITGFYMAYYGAPLQQTPALPNYSTDFESQKLGIYSASPQAMTTSLTDVAVQQTTAPVPEPETYAMMLAGLGVLGFLGRRRKCNNG